MIPGMHVTPGPMTDADAKLYKSAIPNPELPGPANAALRRDIARKEAIAASRSVFFERWAANRGTLNGAEAAFSKFWEGYQARQAAPRKGQAKDPFPGVREGQIVEQGGRRYRRQGSQMVPVS
jgi:hypothetical protein